MVKILTPMKSTSGKLSSRELKYILVRDREFLKANNTPPSLEALVEEGQPFLLNITKSGGNSSLSRISFGTQVFVRATKSEQILE